MRPVGILIALLWLACSSGSAALSSPAANPPPSSLQLFRIAAGQRSLTIQMTPDGHVLDGAGAAVGSFNAKSRTVTIGGVTITLDDVVRQQAGGRVELQLPVGAWQIDVATSGEVHVNGEQWGQLAGFDGTPRAWQRVEALFAALPMLPASSHAVRSAHSVASHRAHHPISRDR
jgi:hypothetical protein